ncbi:transmembrane protein 120 homolog [Amborella trichopoda]|uniref:TMPIT-like protein n=1 Tax=Amborella trichopoda TaxID=13333 RepID=W1PJN7_AMBTC|nr:transmembrane protein 120 homolog [Amborella trichopoda]ERN08213.1 hypothetical protein AMTR_s00018p00200030 [Amborella trichopoda]|eukprot:XP_006846538.1 transmembrane protein 120 homolog [Amborella trichopoda]
MASTNKDVQYLEEVSHLLDRAKELQDSASSFLSKMKHEEQSILQRVSALQSDLKKLQACVASASASETLDKREAEKLEEELSRAKCMIADGDVSSLLPSKSNGKFLRMFLGPISVRATRKDVQLKVKEEYNNYRDRTAVMFLLFPFALLILRYAIWKGCFPAWAVQLYQAWLLFLYTSLALRENILRINGSDIRPWWIYHHYCAMMMALVSLTWEIKGQPDCYQKQRGIELFLTWAMMQGVAMLLQNRYQRQRLYTRIALGKANRMDVVWGETASVEGQLWLLYPVLFILQGFEAYIGILLLMTAVTSSVSEWQVVVCGGLLVIMASGNFANTVQTLSAKLRFKAKMKRSKSKQDLDQGSLANLRLGKSL